MSFLSIIADGLTPYRTVKELNGIQVGPATSFNADKENDITVLNIFPDGNDATGPDEPYFIFCHSRGLRYFSRDLFKYNNTTPIKLKTPDQFKLNHGISS